MAFPLLLLTIDFFGITVALVREKLAALVPALAERMEAIVGDAFVYAPVGGLGLTMVLGLLGVAASFLVRQAKPGAAAAEGAGA